MAERRGRPTRHRLGRRAASVVPTFDELAEADGADVTDLLREVSEFRLALDTDLTIAAAAADAVAERIAPAELSGELTVQAVDAGRSALEDLVTRRRLDVASIHPRLAAAAVASSAVDELAHPGGRGGRRRAAHRGATGPVGGRPAGRRLRGVPLIGVGPLVGVAVAIGLGTGVFASHLHGGAQSQSQNLTNAADSSLHSLSHALGEGDDQAAREAGNQLSAAIGSLIAAAPGNPAAAQAAATALSAEGSLLANASGPLGEQLRASMAAQVVALQNTVHSPIATLLAPVAKATAPGVTIPVPLPTRLLPSLTSITVPTALPVRPLPTRRPSPSHPPPDLDPTLVAIIVASETPPPAPHASAPAAATTPSASPTATPPATTSPASPPSSSPSPSASPTATPTSSEGPLPFSTYAPGGSGGLGH